MRFPSGMAYLLLYTAAARASYPKVAPHAAAVYIHITAPFPKGISHYQSVSSKKKISSTDFPKTCAIFKAKTVEGT